MLSRSRGSTPLCRCRVAKTPMTPRMTSAMSAGRRRGVDLAGRLPVLDDLPDGALHLPVEHA